MKYSKLILVLILLGIFSSCEKTNSDEFISDELIKKSFKYEEFPSNLNESINSAYFLDNKN